MVADVARLQDVAAAGRPDLHAARRARERAQNEVERQRARRAPNVTAAWGYRRDFGVHAMDFAVSIPVPLFGALNPGGVPRAEAERRRRAALEEAAGIAVAVELQQAVDAVEVGAARVRSVEEYVRGAGQARVMVQTSYELGETALIELGDRVRAGQPLVEYDNIALGDHIAEYRGAVAAYRQAEADLAVRRRAFERAEQLIGVEAIAQQTFELRRSELDQAQAGVLGAQAEVTRIEERIHRFGLTDEDLSEVAPRGGAGALQEAAERHREASLNVLRAPFDGVVTEYSVAVGDLVGPDRDLLTITDISTVRVLADVYESDLGRLPPAAEVTIRTEAYPDRIFTGRITYVSDTIEPQTRAAHVRCVVANPDDPLKLGMFASVTIPTNERVAALAVPIAAVQRIDGQPVVFVQTAPATFERRDVTLGSTAGGVVEVPAGIASGERVVSNGSFYLKTALLHDRIGHAH